MKTAILKNTLWLLGLFLTLGFGLVACDDDDDDDTPQNEVRFRNLTLTGPQETPPNNSTNTATIDAVYNKETNEFTYTITWTGFEATNMHFHKRMDPQPGPIALGIPKVPATATTFISPLTDSQTLTDAEETALLANEWYLNIHTAAFPGGELRVNMVPN